MSASFCDCVNQWEQVLGLQVLKDTKHLSVPTRGGCSQCIDCFVLVYLCKLGVIQE